MLGALFLVYLSVTCWAHPLFPFQPSSADWSFAWLLTTVADYYCSTLVLCGVIFTSEAGVAGALWTLGCLILGSWIACAWAAQRLWHFRTLTLASAKEIGK